MIRIMTLLALGGCANEVNLVGHPQPPPAHRTLLVDAPVFLSQSQQTVRVYGGQRGEQVYLIRGARVAPGPCPAAMGGQCAEVGPTASLLAVGVFDGFGAANIDVSVPQLPHGVDVALQAITLQGGVGTSDPVLTVTARRADLVASDLGPGDLVITEFDAEPFSWPQGEWFELFNTTDAVVDLDGLQVGDGWGHAYVLQGTTLVEPHGYAVIAATDNPLIMSGVGSDNLLDLQLRTDADAIRIGPPGMPIDTVAWDATAPMVNPDISSAQFIGTPDSLGNDQVEDWCDGTFDGVFASLSTPGGPNDLQCASRTLPSDSVPPVCEDTCHYAGDGECDDGRPGAPYDVCDPGTDCADCGPLTSACEDTCVYANDGACDDGSPGSATSACAEGTDCTDCSNPTTGTCTETCVHAFDGQCDDGSPGADYALCALGSDCSDCAGNIEPPRPFNDCDNVPAPEDPTPTSCTSNNGRIYVGSVQYQSISSALAAAPSGGVVDVCGGSHSVQSIVITGSVTLRSPMGRAHLEGTGNHQLVRVSPSGSRAIEVALENLELSGGSDVVSGRGGVLEFEDSGRDDELTLRKVLIHSSSADHSVVSLTNAGVAYFVDVTLESNVQRGVAGTDTGGILYVSRTDLVTRRLVLKDNRSDGGALSTAHNSWGNEIHLDEATIIQNEAGADSAAAHIEDSTLLEICGSDFGTVGSRDNSPADVRVEHITYTVARGLGATTTTSY